MRIAPARRLRGSISLPGDKSISHRAALIAALANGDSHLTNFSTSSDCASTLHCLAQLGIRIERSGNDVRIEGVGVGRLSAPRDSLDCGNSGSTMRMLAGVLAGHGFSATLTGDESLRARPMRRIVEPLEKMGARVNCETGYPPLRITGHQPLSAIRYELPVASAQLKSCLLLAGLHANGRTEVIEKFGGTRDHTERMLRWFGVKVETVASSRIGAELSSCSIEGPASFSGSDVVIPGDFSSAAFLIAAAALLPGSELEIEGLGLNPTRRQLLAVLRAMGVEIETLEESEVCNELQGNLRIRGMEIRNALALKSDEPAMADNPNPFAPLIIEGSSTAALIDELPLVAVMGTQISGGVVIRDARELRLKETDRIAATVANLRAMGAEVEEYADGLKTNGPVRLHGANVDAYGDHRIAMAFTVAALIAEGESELTGSQCVAVSFPEFFECLESMVER
ncbi:MAG TPA: 3-phosphoshikimate 1-carboxyvinyltransferase [Pyrinomonadaceae bacterium]|nr:3-phosphoshikimate 1-carboxyvinyltransferase [Pyrinomonadaceae bacterium]